MKNKEQESYINSDTINCEKASSDIDNQLINDEDEIWENQENEQNDMDKHQPNNID